MNTNIEGKNYISFWWKYFLRKIEPGRIVDVDRGDRLSTYEVLPKGKLKYGTQVFTPKKAIGKLNWKVRTDKHISHFLY